MSSYTGPACDVLQMFSDLSARDAAFGSMCPSKRTSAQGICTLGCIVTTLQRLTKLSCMLAKTKRSVLHKEAAFLVDFAQREVVSLFNGVKLDDVTMEVAEYQVPMKYLGRSWDGGYKGAHRSGRDQGSAVGTNFECVSLSMMIISASTLEGWTYTDPRPGAKRDSGKGCLRGKRSQALDTFAHLLTLSCDCVHHS